MLLTGINDIKNSSYKTLRHFCNTGPAVRSVLSKLQQSALTKGYRSKRQLYAKPLRRKTYQPRDAEIAFHTAPFSKHSGEACPWTPQITLDIMPTYLILQITDTIQIKIIVNTVDFVEYQS